MTTYRDIPDGTLYIWAAHKRARTPEIHRRISIHQSEVVCANRLADEGRILAMAGADHEVIIVKAKAEPCDEKIAGKMVRTWDVSIGKRCVRSGIESRREARDVAKKINAGVPNA